MIDVNITSNDMTRPVLIVTNHAIKRWKQRIEAVSDTDAMIAIVAAIASAKPKHLTATRIKKRTFYIPTERALLVGDRGKIVTVLERGQSLYDV